MPTATTTTDLEALRSRVAEALAEAMPKHLPRLTWGPDELANHQRTQLRRLLAYAIENSPFHARRLRDVDPTTFELSDLASLPIMTKSEMMANFDDVVTDRSLRRVDVDEHLRQNAHSPALLHDRYVCLASGGSSGLRGVFVRTVPEFAELGCTIVRPTLARMMALGGPPPGGVPVAYVAAESAVHATGFTAATVTDGPLRIFSVPATLPIAEIVRRLNDAQPPILAGYPTVTKRLADEQRAGRLRISPLTVTCHSEQLTPEVQADIGDAFGVPVSNAFGSTEGLFGFSEPGETPLTFATDICIVELVDADNQPVAPGTPSAKVLITSLHDLTQPLIRYELTDSFIEQPGGDSRFLRATVDGRSDDVFRYGGVEIHPLVIRSVFVKTPEVREYQVRQTPSGVEIDVVADDGIDLDSVASKLATGLQEAGLPDPEVTLHRVDSIAAHAETGKTRRFIPVA